MKNELETYHELIVPLRVNQPKLYEHYSDEAMSLFIMEDVGGETLESYPDKERFLEAARELARMKILSLERIQELKIGVRQKYMVNQEDMLHQLIELQQEKRLTIAQKSIVAHVVETFAIDLKRLYSKFPISLCHNDYFAKNIVVREKDVAIIDWALSRLSPDIGDLYCLKKRV